MKRKQIMVWAVSVIVVVFGGLSVWRLMMELREATAAEKQRDAARGQLDGIYQLNPFPNAANRSQAADDRKKMKLWVAALGTLLVDTNTATSLSPPLFMQNLQRDINELAALTTSAGVKLVPDGFAFGFDRYRGVDGRMPEPEDVPRLFLQLKMIDRLCHELAAADILALSAVRREEFESGISKTAADPVMEGGRSRTKRSRPPSGGAVSKSAIPGAQRSVRHHFAIEFSARKNATFEALNRLAAMDLFVVVTDVAIRKTADDLKVAPAIPEVDKGAKGKETSDPIQRVVAGPLVDPPLSVRIELDVHVFEGV